MPGNVIAATPVNFAPPAAILGEKPPSSSEHAKASSSTDREKASPFETRSTVVHFAVPPNFISNDTVYR